MKKEARYIYHICQTEEWEKQRDKTHYHHPSLTSEGFIHCSLREQIEGVLQRYFAGQNDLSLLQIDVESLEPKLMYEMAPIGEAFPHIYGKINTSAITKVEAIFSGAKTS